MIALPARSRSTKPTLEALKRASGAARSRKSPSLWSQQRKTAGIGRIRLRRVKDVSAESLLDFIRETVEPGATIHTDGWKGYAGLPEAGYKHRVTVISGGDEQAHEVMPRVHNVASLLKRWLLGTLQGGVQHQHLDYYLDEFTFRFNRRRSNARGLLFYRLAQQAVDSVRRPTVPLSGANRPHVRKGDTHYPLLPALSIARKQTNWFASDSELEANRGQQIRLARAPVAIAMLSTPASCRLHPKSRLTA